MLRYARGNAAVEFALVAPLLLSLLAFSVDFGAVYAQRARLSAAAQSAADTAAHVLSASDLSGQVVPAVAEAAARAAVVQALGAAAGAVSVSVRWEGAVAQETQELPRYAMTLQVPEVENVSQDLDTRHAHGFSWDVPVFGRDDRVRLYTAPLSWQDVTDVVAPVATRLVSWHGYRDRYDDYVTGLPSGQAFGYGGLGTIYVGYWSAFGGPPYVSGISTTYYDGITDTVVVTVPVSGVTGNTTLWRSGTSDPIGIMDRTMVESGRTRERGTSWTDGVQLTFRYAARRPPRTVTFYSEPNFRLVQRRTLVVEVSSVFSASSMITRPLLDGRVVTGRGTSVVTSAMPL